MEVLLILHFKRILESGASTFCAATGGAITLTVNGSANNWTSAITGNSTTSQSFGLLIQGGTNCTDGALRVRNQANTLDWLYVRGDGNIGIGTTFPSSTFHIRGTFGAPLTTGTCLNGVARFGQTSGNGGLDIGFGDPYSWLQSRNATDYSVNYNLSLQPNGGRVGVGTISPSQNFAVVGAIKSSVSTSDGAAIAFAYGRTLYKILVSSNYDGGNAVRAGEWNVLTNNEGTAITNTTQIYNYNSQSATFSVSGGNIIISGLSAGNNQAAVFTN
jgi:hypothetical protein